MNSDWNIQYIEKVNRVYFYFYVDCEGTIQPSKNSAQLFQEIGVQQDNSLKAWKECV